MSDVLFIRHAETDMAGLFCGHSDPPLNDRGLSQMDGLVRTLASESIGSVYSSDLRRAQQTASAIARSKGLQVEVRPMLREIDFGAWEGLSWLQIEERDAAYAQEWLAAFPELPAPLGESFSQFKSRVVSEVRQMVACQDGSIVVVTHAGVLRVVQQEFLGCAEPWKESHSYCGVLRWSQAGMEC